MIFLIAWLLLAIFGIQALVSGKVSLSKTRIITGKSAKIMGIIALMPFPVAFVLGFSLGFYWGATRPGQEMPLVLPFLVNVGALVLVGIGIAIVASRAPKSDPEAAVEE